MQEISLNQTFSLSIPNEFLKLLGINTDKEIFAITDVDKKKISMIFTNEKRKDIPSLKLWGKPNIKNKYLNIRSAIRKMTLTTRIEDICAGRYALPCAIEDGMIKISFDAL